jgi:uncharacterized protein YacL
MAKSNHQPFENWIFLREMINREEELALQAHLRQCEHCQSLSGAMQAMEHSLKTAPVVSPSPGFSTRWLARLEENRISHQRKQTAIFTLAIIGGAIIMLVLSVILMWPLFRAPFPYVLAVAYQLALIYSFMDTIATTGIAVYKTLFKIIPPTMLVSLFLATGGIVAIWIAAIGKFVYPRRVTI